MTITETVILGDSPNIFAYKDSLKSKSKFSKVIFTGKVNQRYFNLSNIDYPHLLTRYEVKGRIKALNELSTRIKKMYGSTHYFLTQLQESQSFDTVPIEFSVSAVLEDKLDQIGGIYFPDCSVDIDKKIIYLANQETIRYKNLVVLESLDKFITRLITPLSDIPPLNSTALGIVVEKNEYLQDNTIEVKGIGNYLISLTRGYFIYHFFLEPFDREISYIIPSFLCPTDYKIRQFTSLRLKKQDIYCYSKAIWNSELSEHSEYLRFDRDFGRLDGKKQGRHIGGEIQATN